MCGSEQGFTERKIEVSLFSFSLISVKRSLKLNVKNTKSKNGKDAHKLKNRFECFYKKIKELNKVDESTMNTDVSNAEDRDSFLSRRCWRRVEECFGNERPLMVKNDRKPESRRSRPIVAILKSTRKTKTIFFSVFRVVSKTQF